MAKKRLLEAVKSNDQMTKRWRMTFASARMAYETGEFRQAESLLARAREMANELPEHTFAANATEVGMAAVMLAERRPKEASKHLLQTIARLEAQPDKEHKELLAVAKRFYAQSLLDLNDERDAEKELNQSAEILKELGPDASVQLAYTLADLCGLYLAQGRISEAESQITKVMKIVGRELTPEHPEYVRADMIYSLCLPMEAETRLEVASDGIRRMEYAFGAKHPNIARVLDRYFHVLKQRGDTVRIEETQAKFNAKIAALK